MSQEGRDEVSVGGLHEGLVDAVSTLGVASLTDHLTPKKVDQLQKLGHQIDPSTLAEVLVTENGVNLFRDKRLRLDLLISRDREQLKELVGSEGELNELVIKFNEFSWGNNHQSKLFLKLFGISPDFLHEEPKSLRPLETVALEKPLHPYQNWLRKKMLRFLFSSEKSRAIVHMPTGSGKTRTCLEAVCDFIRHQTEKEFAIVWFAHSEELCEQAVESFSTLWSRLGSEPVNILRLWGGSRVDSLAIDCPTFVVTSFQTAYQLLRSSDDSRFGTFVTIKNACDLLVVDEAHQSTAPTYREAIELFSNRLTQIIGLTATPGRHHVGADVAETMVLADFYQNNKIDIVDDSGATLEDPIRFLTDKGVLSQLEQYQLDSGTNLELTESERRHIENLLDIPKSVLERLGQDEKRTNLIASQALKLTVEFRYQTTIFAPSKENAIELATLLRLKGCKADSITGETPLEQRRESIKLFKEGKVNVLTNFGVLTTGFDAPNIQAVIIARPTTSVVLYSQMIGRGLRGSLMGGSEECLLINVQDNIANMPNVNQAFAYFNEYFFGD